MNVTVEKQTELLTAWRSGDRSAGDRLFEQYRYAIDDVVCNHVERGRSDIDDLRQEGYLKFVQDLDRYDPAKSQISTAIYNWVRQHAIDYTRSDNVIRIPRSREARTKYQKQAEAARGTQSCHGEDTTDLGSIYTEDSRIDDRIDGESLWGLAREALTEYQLTLLTRCLAGGETLQDIANDIGVSRQAVSLTYNRGLRELRARCGVPEAVA